MPGWPELQVRSGTVSPVTMSSLPRAVRSMVLAALTVRLIDEWWSYLPGGVIENLRSDLGVSYTQAGSLISIAMLSGLVGGPLGALADVWDRRLLAVMGSALQTLGLVLFAAGDRFWVLAFGVLLLGAAGDLVIGPLEAALAESMTGEQLERSLGRQHLLSFVGDLLGPVTLAIGAATFIGWRGVFWATAAALGLYTVFISTVHYPPRHVAATDERVPMTELIRNRSVLRLIVLYTLLFPLDEPVAAFAVAAIAIDRPVTAQFIAVGYVVGGLASSAVVDRRGINGAARRYGGPCLALGALLVAAAVASHELGSISALTAAVAATAAMTVVGVGMGFVWADLHHRELTVVPGRSASVAAIVGTLSSVGAFWPTLAGWIADQASISAALCVFAVAAALVMALSGDPRVDKSFDNSG